MDGWKQSALALIFAACVAVGGGRARAQQAATTPDNSAAVKAAESWLALLDAGQYGESWDQSAAILKSTIERADWIKNLKAKRQQYGKVVSRKLVNNKPLKNVPGLPAGDLVAIQYQVSLAKLPNATELVIPMLDKDGQWRVSEYVLQPPTQ